MNQSNIKELTDQIVTRVIIFGKCLPNEKNESFVQIACSDGETVFSAYIRDKFFLKKILLEKYEFSRAPFYCKIRIRQYLTKDGVKNLYDILKVNKTVRSVILK